MKTIGFILLSLLFLQSCTSSEKTLAQKLEDKSNSGMKNASLEKLRIRREFNRATTELRDSGIEKKALSKGLKVPDFKVGNKNFSSFYKDKVTIIKFYRGHWCPYCMIELKEYEGLNAQFKKENAQIIAFAPDQLKFIKKTKRDHNITFPIYRDKDLKIAKKFGLAFKMDTKVVTILKKFKINLDKSQGNKKGEVPMPGTYVVDKNGIIQFAFYDADYKKRANPMDVLAVVKKLNK